MDTPDQTDNLDALSRCCEQERQRFYYHGVRESPCCMDLFRRAFGGDHAAWDAVWQVFRPQMQKWVSKAGFIEVDDTLNELMLHLFLKAPEYPYLVAGNEIGLVLDFLKRKVKLIILEEKRKAERHTFHTSLDDSVPSPTNVQHQVEQDDLMRCVRARATELFQTDEEQCVFTCAIVCEMKPGEILSSHPDLFPSMKDVRNAIKRVMRRLRNDETVQHLLERGEGTWQKPSAEAFLEMRTIEELEQGEMIMSTLCHLDEDRLLDYLLEDRSDDLRVAVEQSPVCMQEVHRLRQELVALQRVFYRSTCPDEETLIAYQEGRLTGTEQLRLRKHLMFCPLCQEELAMLAAVDAVPSHEPFTNTVRRVVRAMFQPPLAAALRGSILCYQTSFATIHLTFSQRTARGKSRTWTLRGQMRTLDGHLMADVLEEAEVQRTDHPQPSTTGTIETNGSFVFAGLPAGTFTVRLITVEETIEIKDLVIGDGDGEYSANG
jgi:hypothetical protein